jgi:hypothetical protein
MNFFRHDGKIRKRLEEIFPFLRSGQDTAVNLDSHKWHLC